MAPLSAAVLAISSVLVAPSAAADPAQPPCKRFDEIYATGKELCENLWNDSYVYEEDESKAFTMWFWDKTNPNDATSRDLGLLTGNHHVCHLDNFHKDAPGPEPDSFTECHPWKSNSCCAHQTVESAQKMKESYGAKYHWDRCGPLSPECERFFVQEACFYECDPNAGLFRKWNSTVYNPRCDKYAFGYDEAYAKAQVCDHNAWQMFKMPIKASYCDSWLRICAKDRFCASDTGDYFTCAAEYKAVDLEAAELAELAKKEKELNATMVLTDRLEAEVVDLMKSSGIDPVIVILIVVLAIVAGIAVCGGLWLIRLEKIGKPVFAKQVDVLVKAVQADTYGQLA